MDGSNGAKQADSWHKHEPFMMVEKQKNKGKHSNFEIKKPVNQILTPPTNLYRLPNFVSWTGYLYLLGNTLLAFVLLQYRSYIVYEISDIFFFIQF